MFSRQWIGPAVALVLVGCATHREAAPPPDTLAAGEVRSVRQAADAVAIGKSTKADVRAALGPATVVDFASGYEVWLYREKPAQKLTKGERPAPLPPKSQWSELVLLFSPSGVVSNARTRTPSPASNGRWSAASTR